MASRSRRPRVRPSRSPHRRPSLTRTTTFPSDRAPSNHHRHAGANAVELSRGTCGYRARNHMRGGLRNHGRPGVCHREKEPGGLSRDHFHRLGPVPAGAGPDGNAFVSCACRGGGRRNEGSVLRGSSALWAGLQVHFEAHRGTHFAGRHGTAGRHTNARRGAGLLDSETAA